MVRGVKFISWEGRTETFKLQVSVNIHWMSYKTCLRDGGIYLAKSRKYWSNFILKEWCSTWAAAETLPTALLQGAASAIAALPLHGLPWAWHAPKLGIHLHRPHPHLHPPPTRKESGIINTDCRFILITISNWKQSPLLLHTVGIYHDILSNKTHLSFYCIFLWATVRYNNLKF